MLPASAKATSLTLNTLECVRRTRFGQSNSLGYASSTSAHQFQVDTSV